MTKLVQDSLVHTIAENQCSSADYLAFKRVYAAQDRTKVVFEYPNHVKYIVPATYINTWYLAPDCRYLHGRWHSVPDNLDDVNWNQLVIEHKQTFDDHNVEISRIRQIRWPFIKQCYGYARVYLTNGVAHLVHPDHVLCSCEPAFEHFGGFTEEEKRIGRQRLKQFEGELRARIARSDITKNDFGGFRQVEVTSGGYSVSFTLHSADRYELPVRGVLDILRKKIAGEHECNAASQLIVMPKSKDIRITHKSYSEKKTRVILTIGDLARVSIRAIEIVESCDYRYSG